MPQDTWMEDIWMVERDIQQDEEATSAVVRAYAGYVRTMIRPYSNAQYCRRVFGPTYGYKDLWQECMNRLIIADAKFNAKYDGEKPWGTGAEDDPFKPYLGESIRNLLRTLHRNNMDKDRDLRSIEGTAYVYDDGEVSEMQIEDTTMNVSRDADSVLSIIDFAQKMLSPVQRAIVTYMHFLLENGYKVTDEEVARELKLSESKVLRERNKMKRLAFLYAEAEVTDWGDFLRFMPKLVQDGKVKE